MRFQFSRVIVIKIFATDLESIIQFIKTFRHSNICSEIDLSYQAVKYSKQTMLGYIFKAYVGMMVFSGVTTFSILVFGNEKELAFGDGMSSFNSVIYYFFKTIQIFLVYLERFVDVGFDCCFADLCISFATCFLLVALKFEVEGNGDDIQVCTEAFVVLRR